MTSKHGPLTRLVTNLPRDLKHAIERTLPRSPYTQNVAYGAWNKLIIQLLEATLEPKAQPHADKGILSFLEITLKRDTISTLKILMEPIMADYTDEQIDRIINHINAQEIDIDSLSSIVAELRATRSAVSLAPPAKKKPVTRRKKKEPLPPPQPPEIELSSEPSQ